MFYLFVERPITGSLSFQTILKTAANQLPIQPSIPWTIYYPSNQETFQTLSNWCYFHTTRLPYHLLIRDTQFQPDDWIFYLTIPSKYSHHQTLFNICEISDWQWIFQAIPTIFHFIPEKQNNLIYHLPLSSLVHDIQSHFLLTYFHSFTHPHLSQTPVQDSYQELPTYLGFFPNEKQTIFQQWKEKSYPFTPGFFYWQHPHLLIQKLMQSFPSIKNTPISTILQNFKDEEFFHWQNHQNDLLPHLELYHLFYLYQEPKFPQHEFSFQSFQPSFYFFHSSFQPMIQSHLAQWLFTQAKYSLFKIDLSQWMPYIHYIYSKKLPSLSLAESRKLHSIIQALHDYCRPIPFLSAQMIHPFQFPKTPPIFLWFPFQEEYNHSILKDTTTNSKATNQFPDIIQQFKNNHRITSCAGQVRTYFQQLQVGFRFVHLHRTTDWAEFNENEWWNPETKTYDFPYQPSLQHKTHLKIYQAEHQRFGQEFVLVWVWDCLSVPFMYQEPCTGDSHRFNQWKDQIRQIWTVILQQNEYVKASGYSGSREKSPIMYVAIPQQGWELFENLWETVFRSRPELKRIQWRFVSHYPLRANNHTMTESCPPPFSMSGWFDESHLDFQTLPSLTTSSLPWKESVYRVPYRLDTHDLYQWILWFRCIEQSWQKLLQKKPIFHTTTSTIQWQRSPWNQWFLVWRQGSQPDAHTDTRNLLNCAHQAQQANLPFFLIRVWMSQEDEDEQEEEKSWRGTVWHSCGDQDADGCLINCSLLGENFHEVEPLTIEKCLKVYYSMRSLYTDRVPLDWIPSKFLDSSRDVPSRMATQ